MNGSVVASSSGMDRGVFGSGVRGVGSDSTAVAEAMRRVRAALGGRDKAHRLKKGKQGKITLGARVYPPSSLCTGKISGDR